MESQASSQAPTEVVIVSAQRPILYVVTRRTQAFFGLVRIPTIKRRRAAQLTLTAEYLLMVNRRGDTLLRLELAPDGVARWLEGNQDAYGAWENDPARGSRPKSNSPRDIAAWYLSFYARFFFGLLTFPYQIIRRLLESSGKVEPPPSRRGPHAYGYRGPVQVLAGVSTRRHYFPLLGAIGRIWLASIVFFLVIVTWALVFASIWKPLGIIPFAVFIGAEALYLAGTPLRSWTGIRLDVLQRDRIPGMPKVVERVYRWGQGVVERHNAGWKYEIYIREQDQVDAAVVALSACALRLQPFLR